MEEEKIKTNTEVLSKAIRRRSVVSFFYPGYEQIVVEPVILGVSKETGKQVLRCYKCFPPHIFDSKENWYLLEVDLITNLKTTPMRSKNFRKGSQTIEGDMSEIIEASEDYIKQ